MKVIYIVFLLIVLISGCVDKNTVDINLLRNDTVSAIYTIKEKAPSDVCIKIDNNQSCVSDVKNISINISTNRDDAT